MSTKSIPIRRFGTARRHAYTVLEVLLVIGIVGLYCVCIIGYFLSLHVEPLNLPSRKPGLVKATPAPAKSRPAKPLPVGPPPVAPAPAEAAIPPAPPAEPAP